MQAGAIVLAGAAGYYLYEQSKKQDVLHKGTTSKMAVSIMQCTYDEIYLCDGNLSLCFFFRIRQEDWVARVEMSWQAREIGAWLRRKSRSRSKSNHSTHHITE